MGKNLEKTFSVGGEKATAINKTYGSFINRTVSVANKLSCSSSAVTNVAWLTLLCNETLHDVSVTEIFMPCSKRYTHSM